MKASCHLGLAKAVVLLTERGVFKPEARELLCSSVQALLLKHLIHANSISNESPPKLMGGVLTFKREAMLANRNPEGKQNGHISEVCIRAGGRRPSTLTMTF